MGPRTHWLCAVTLCQNRESCQHVDCFYCKLAPKKCSSKCCHHHHHHQLSNSIFFPPWYSWQIGHYKWKVYNEKIEIICLVVESPSQKTITIDFYVLINVVSRSNCIYGNLYWHLELFRQCGILYFHLIISCSMW